MLRTRTLCVQANGPSCGVRLIRKRMAPCPAPRSVVAAVAMATLSEQSRARQSLHNLKPEMHWSIHELRISACLPRKTARLPRSAPLTMTRANLEHGRSRWIRTSMHRVCPCGWTPTATSRLTIMALCYQARAHCCRLQRKAVSMPPTAPSGPSCV